MKLPWKIVPLSPARRAILWWFSGSNPYVCVTVTIDFRGALAYIESLGSDEPKVSINHLLVAAIGRLLREFPEANGRIVGNRIVTYDRVGIAMPVNLLGHPGGDRSGSELGMMVLEDIDRLSLREIAAKSRARVEGEREGRAENSVIRWLLRVANHAPEGAFETSLHTLDRALSRPRVIAEMFERVPATTALSNPGAGFGGVEGALFRAASIELPRRLVHVATFWGVSAIQDEVFAIDGEPKVVSALPLLLVFDHRLVDGIMTSRILRRLVDILKDPAAVFGDDGRAAR